MTLDRKKAVIWIVAIFAGIAGYLFLHEKEAPRPPAPPITVTLPDPPPVPEPKIIVVPVPTKQLDQQKPPAAKPVAPKKKITPKDKPKSAKQNPCAKVPAKAYQYPKDVVIAAAEARGIPADAMAILKKCIGAS